MLKLTPAKTQILLISKSKVHNGKKNKKIEIKMGEYVDSIVDYKLEILTQEN